MWFVIWEEHGCAIAIQYRDGILEKAISKKGRDCTTKIAAIPDVPSNIKIKGLFQVSGELLTLQNMQDQLILKDRQAPIFGLLIAKAIILAFVVFRS